MLSSKQILCAQGCAATFVCIEKVCTHLPYGCGSKTCVCFNAHRRHATVQLEGYQERLAEVPPMSKEWKCYDKAMTGLIDTLGCDIEKLRQLHRKHMDEGRLKSWELA